MNYSSLSTPCTVAAGVIRDDHYAALQMNEQRSVIASLDDATLEAIRQVVRAELDSQLNLLLEAMRRQMMGRLA